MPKLSIDGPEPIRLHYDDYGSGDPVVLIHGWPLSCRS
jgi:non-heme chloroperoxidase